MRTRYIEIGKRKIGRDQPVFIIAEAGVNHNGRLKLAKKLVDAAKSAGADAVKFQTFKTEKLITAKAPKANYQKKTVPSKSQYEMLKSLELSTKDFKELSSYCQKKGILFLSTPFDLESAEFLNRLGVPAFKISSGDLTNTPLLLQIAKYGKPIILSTGMATIEEIKEAVKVIYSKGNKKLILLHCTSNYPTKYEDVNLKAIDSMRKMFNIPIGYSDHTLGIEVPIAAVTLGACVIEKHFTLDRGLEGPDHKASIEPLEFKKMVYSIRNIEVALGDGIKILRKSESEVRRVARKSLVALRDVMAGETLTSEHIGIKRPGTGLPPKYLSKVIGKIAKKPIKKDSVISWGMLS